MVSVFISKNYRLRHMARSQETFNKKEIRNKKEKKRKLKVEKKAARKESDKSGDLEDMIAYVDEFETPPDPSFQDQEVVAESISISVPKDEAAEPEDLIRNGIVTFFNDSKGYGFIRDMANQNSIFVHINNTIDLIKDNNAVTFEIEMGPKGPTATKVKLKV
jgi:cold shock CspA family protein